jgi:ketosteroid isomerase-like protein
MISQGPIEDRLAIRELVESYNDAVMRFDAEAWGANWAEDGTWSLPGGNAVDGRENIVNVWNQAMSNFSFVGFFASAGPILVDGDSARGTWYQQEFLHQKDGVRRNITGLYEDEYVRSGGRWLFRKRVYNILNAEETPAAG